MKALKLLFLSLLVSSFTFAEVSPNEKEALVALYNATNGSDWNATWNLNRPVKSWHGVTLENDHVVELTVQFNNLQGTLPSELGNLVYLRKINFGFNKLQGTIPNAIKNLQNLTSLELFMNRFEGTIPSELGELKKLEILKLYSNKFSGEFPQALLGLTNLRELLLGSNYLNGSIPRDINRLLKLEKLSLTTLLVKSHMKLPIYQI